MLSNYNSINVDSENTNTNTRKKSDRNYLWIGSIIFGITLIIIIITVVIDGNNNNNTYSNYFGNIFDNVHNNNNVETGETGETGERVERVYPDGPPPAPIPITAAAAWVATGQLSDLSKGDLILIRHARTSGLLKSRDSTYKVAARETVYPDARELEWTVGKSEDGYTFRNAIHNCFLQYDNGYLKCLPGSNNGNNGYWKSGGTDHLDGDVSSYPRYSTILKNSGNNKCPRVGWYRDDKLSMTKDYCKDYDHAGFVFEILTYPVFTPNMDLNEYTWIVENFFVGLSSGDIIAIRSAYTSTLLNNPSNSNIVKTTDTYDSDRNLWIVGYDESDDTYLYTFQSLKDNCYLQFDNGYLKCRSTLDDKSYWKVTDCGTIACIVLKNDYNGKFVQATGTTASSVDNWKAKLMFQFEIVHHV